MRLNKTLAVFLSLFPTLAYNCDAQSSELDPAIITIHPADAKSVAGIRDIAFVHDFEKGCRVVLPRAGTYLLDFYYQAANDVWPPERQRVRIVVEKGAPQDVRFHEFRSISDRGAKDRVVVQRGEIRREFYFRKKK